MTVLNNKYEKIKKILWEDQNDPNLLQEFCFELEKLMCWQDEVLMKNCPSTIKKAFQKDNKEGCPAAISHHPVFGYFHIWSAGQGPGLGKYEDRNDDLLKERISKLNDEQKKKYLS